MKLTEGWNNLDTSVKQYVWNNKKKKKAKELKVSCGEPVTSFKLSEEELEEYLKGIHSRPVVRRK